MKTQLFRVGVLALLAGNLVLCGGCQEDRSQGEVPHFTRGPAGYPVARVDPAPTPSPMLENTNTVLETTNVVLESTNAAPDQAPAVKVVQAPVPPADTQSSRELAEVIKLVNSGVSEEVILAYVQNSPNAFNVTADQIVYLNDLGVSTPIVTAMQEHKPANVATKTIVTSPLPSNFALTTPATNIFPTDLSNQNIPAPGAVGPPPPDQNDPNAYPVATPPMAAPTSDYFYSSLAPYGSWIDVEGYGRCWQPTVAVASPGWRPYWDRGHWLWSDCGWYWYSDYSWGWAPFHYGRWCSYPSVGWFWVPGTCWGPSWVSWRYSPGYCGWAPLPPAAYFVAGQGFYHHGVHVGVGIEFGLTAGLYGFVPLNHFHDHGFHAYHVSGAQATAIYRSSTVVNNYRVNGGTVVNNGVGVDKVAHASGHPIQTVKVQSVTPTSTTPRTDRRYEQLHNNGSTLTVVRPPLATHGTPAKLVSGGSAGSSTPLLDKRVSPAPRPSAVNPVVMKPQAGNAGTISGSQETPKSTASTASTVQPARTTSQPNPLSPRGALTSRPGNSQNGNNFYYRSSAAPVPPVGQPRTTVLPPVQNPANPTTPAAQSQNHSIRTASRGEYPLPVSPSENIRTLSGAQASAPPVTSRAYPQSGYVPPSSVPRPQAGYTSPSSAPRVSGSVPVPARPQYTPNPSAVTPTAPRYSEAPRAPTYSAPANSAPVAATPRASAPTPRSESRATNRQN